MKKWYEYQLSQISEHNCWQNHEYAPIKNIFNEMKNDFDFLKKEYHALCKENDPKLGRGGPLVGSNNYIDYIKKHYDDPIVKENANAWCTDPQFKNLLTLPSIDQLDITIHYPDIAKRLCTLLDRDFDYCRANLQVQPPGYVSPLHIDAMIKRPQDRGRLFVLLDDWAMGQVFQMGDKFIKWRAGDVFTWELRDVPHALANIGYYHRFAILLFFGVSPGK